MVDGVLSIHVSHPQNKIIAIIASWRKILLNSSVNGMCGSERALISFEDNKSFRVNRVQFRHVGTFPAAGLELCAGALPLPQELGGICELVDEVKEYAVGAGIVVAGQPRRRRGGLASPEE